MAILHQYWLLKEFCILSFEKNLNIVIDFSIIYKSIKKSYKLLSPPKGIFFFYEIFFVMNYWIMILVICGFFVVLYLRGNYKTNILKFFKEIGGRGGGGRDSLSGSVPGRNTRLPQEILQNLISPQWNLPINSFKDPKHLLDTCFNGLSKKSSHTKPYLSPLSVILVRKIPTT